MKIEADEASVDSCKVSFNRPMCIGQADPPPAENGQGGAPQAAKILPPFQKDGYTLLRETYLKTPGADRDSNHTIRN